MGKSSGKPKLKRHHHTVPRLLLRRFADGKLLVRVPLDGGEPKICGIGDVTVHRDFYSMRNEAGQLDDTVENLLADLEDQAAKVLRRITIEGVWPLPIAERAILAQWIAAQHARIPAARRANNEIADQLGKILIAAGGKPEIRRFLEEEATEPVSDEEVDAVWAEVMDFSSYTTELPVNDHMLTMARSMKTAYPVMMERSWGLCRFERKTLLLPDHPVTLLRDARQPEWRGVGLVNAAAILIPIDRRAAIIMGAPGPDFEFPATAKVAKELNHRFAWNARTDLFHHPDDDPLAGIDLPSIRDRETWFSQSPENFLLPDGPPDVSRTS